MIFKNLPQNIKRGLYRKGEYGSPEARFQPQDEVPMALLERFNIRGEKAAESYRAKQFDQLVQSDPGGLYEYNITYDVPGEEGLTTLKIEKDAPLSEQDRAFFTDVLKSDFKNAPENIDFQLNLKQDPQVQFEEAFSRGLFGDMSRANAEAAFAGTPTIYTNALKGEDTSALALAGDFTSAPGRGFMAMFREEEGPIEMARTTSDVKTEDITSTPLKALATVAQMGGDLARDPFTLPSMGIGTGIAAGSKGLGALLKREALLGAAEGFGSELAAQQRGISSGGAGDVALSSLMGGTLGAAIPGVTQGGKQGLQKLRRYNMTKPDKETITDKLYKAQEDLYTITPLLDPAGPRAKQWMGGNAIANYKPGMRTWYKDKLGVESPEELFPTLGMSNRNSEMIKDIRDLSTRNPRVFEKWQNTYRKLLGGIDQITNYSNAPTLEEAGTLIQKNVQQAKDNFFNAREDTYATILDNPETRAAVDMAMDTKAAAKLKADLEEYQKALSTRKSKMGVKQDITEEQMVPIVKKDFVGTRIDALEPQKVKIGEESVTIDNPLATREVNAAINKQISEVKGVINALDSRLSGAWQPGEMLGGADLAGEVNKLRSNLQANVQYRNFMDKDPIQDEVTKKLRNDLADFFVGAVEKADPALARRLKRNNQDISDFLNDLDVIKKDMTAADKGTISDEALTKRLLNNNSKLDALRSLLVMNGLEKKAFDPVIQSWFKHRVMKESAKTADVKDSVRKQLKDNESFVKDTFGAKVYDELANYTEGLATIGDPQLIGLGSQLNKSGESALNVPTTSAQALKAMKEAMGINSRTVSKEDQRKLKRVFQVQRGADFAEFGPTEPKLNNPGFRNLAYLASGLGRTGARNLFTGSEVEARNPTTTEKQKENLFKRLQRK